MSQQLEVGERVDENSIGRPAVGPESLIVRGNADAVADALAPWGEPEGSSGFLILATSLWVAKSTTENPFVRFRLCEDPAARAVGVTLNNYREHSLVVLNLPGDFHFLEIKDGYELSAWGAGGRELAVAVNATS